MEVQGRGFYMSTQNSTEMDDKSFIVAARLRIPMGDHVTHCHKIYDDTICGAELDETESHASANSRARQRTDTTASGTPLLTF